MSLPKMPKLQLVDRVDWLLELCRGKGVLHLGCADFNPIHHSFASKRLSENLNLHVALSRVCSELVGVDISESGVQLLREKCGFNNLFVVDLENIDLSRFTQPFDVIVAGELIEHLNNPGKFLCGIKSLMTPKTLLVLTTPNTYSLKLILYSLFGRERVNEDHRFFFSFCTLKRILQVNKFSTVGWYTALEKTGGPRNAIANKLLYPFFKSFPRYSDTMICLAKLNNL